MRYLLLSVLLVACGGSDDARVDRHVNDDPQDENAAERAVENGIPFPVQPSAFELVDESPGMRRYSSPPGSACMVDVRWWRPMPPNPGGPMQVASRRAVSVMGEEREVLRTSMFEGEEREVDVVMVPGEGVHTRIVFTDCGRVEIDMFLATLGEEDPRAAAIRTAEAFVRAQGYTDVPPTVPPGEIVREGIEGTIEMRLNTLDGHAVAARGEGDDWMVIFGYRDPEYAGRGRAVRLAGDAPPHLVHQGVVLSAFE